MPLGPILSSFMQDPVAESIMGSQDREFAHAESMQSKDLSAKSSMHKSSLANAMKIAKLQYGTQRYGIDVGREVSMRGQDFEREVAMRGQDFELMAQRWRNALQYLGMAAQMRGPGDWLSYLNFTRGAANQGAPAFLASLMGEGQVQDFGQAGGRALPASLAGIAADLGYTGGGTAAPNGAGALTPAQQQTIGAVNQIAQNMHRLPAGSLEGLSEDEQEFLLGTASSSGHSIPTLLAQYQQSRIGQGSSQAA